MCESTVINVQAHTQFHTSLIINKVIKKVKNV